MKPGDELDHLEPIEAQFKLLVEHLDKAVMAMDREEGSSRKWRRQ